MNGKNTAESWRGGGEEVGGGIGGAGEGVAE